MVQNPPPGSRFEDRRATQRFSIAMDLKFGGLIPGPDEAEGSGRTVNISSKGLLFIADTPVPVGSWLSLSIDWPMAPGEGTVTLAARGRVVHSSEGRIGVILNWHEFRRQRLPKPQAVSESAN